MLPDSGIICALSVAFTFGLTLGVLIWEYQRWKRRV